MDVIEIDCPKCSTPLELDAAFAGGVCRCSECGTLMAVPADSTQQAETLERPDAPGGGRADSPTSGRPDSPAASAGGRADSPVSSRPDSPAGSGIAPPPGSTELAAADTTDIDALASTTGAAEVYVTPSGRTVQVQKHAAVPTAQRKKKAIRFTAIALMVLLTAALTIGIVIFANILFGGDDVEEGPKTFVGVDPDKNPMIEADANLLGIEVGKDVAILIDGSGFAKDWLPAMRDVVYEAVEKSPTSQFLIVAWTDLGTSSFTKDKPAKITKEDLPKFRRFLDRIPSIAPATPNEAVKEALNLRMDQIVLISGFRLDESDANSIKEAVDAKVDTRFDVILITDAGDHDPVLQSVAEGNEGKYKKLPRRKLEAWHNAWKDAKASPKDRSPTKDAKPKKDAAGKDSKKAAPVKDAAK